MSFPARGPERRADGRLERLPLLTLYLSERCNSRCISCDYWRFGRTDLTLAAVEALLPALAALRTELVLLSGGEPLLNPEWPAIAWRLREQGLKLWLLSSGLALLKHARRVAALFERVTVSLDGTDAATYQAIRGLDAFDNVCAGVRAAAGLGVNVTVRVTLQRANYLQLLQFVALARSLGARAVSFLAVDVANPHAFARPPGAPAPALALTAADLPQFARLLQELEREHAEDFLTGFIAESPRRLRAIAAYFSAVCGQGAYPAVRCNAPEFSAVVDAKGRVSPCFFIPGPPTARLDAAGLCGALNQDASLAQRREIRAGAAAECRTCVCALWRPPQGARAPDEARAAHA